MRGNCPHCGIQVEIPKPLTVTGGSFACQACSLPIEVILPQIPAASLPTAASVVAVTSVPTPSTGFFAGHRTLILLSVAAFTVVMIGFMGLAAVGVITFGVMGSSRPEGSESSAKEAAAKIEHLINEQEAKAEDLRNSIKELETERSKLKGEKEELNRNRESLEKEIQSLTTRLESLNKWKRADFVMVNPNSFAVGLKTRSDGQLEVVQRSEGVMQVDAIQWAKKEGHLPIDQNPALTRRLYDEVTPGESVPEILAAEVRRYWRPQRFVPFAPEDGAPPFLVFQDAERGARHLGFYLGHEQQQLKFRGVAPTDDAIPWSRIQVGSARVAAGSKILTSLGDADFIDYCVLNAAQKLGSPDGVPAIVRLAVHMQVDALSEELALSRRMDTRLTDQVFEFYARMHEKPYPRDARKEPVRVLREIAMYLEDELYQKLSRMGVPLVERQQIRAVIDESQFGKRLGDEAKQHLTQMGATHILFADIQAPQDGGKFHFACRITDARRGQVLWAETGERLSPQPAPHQRFLLQTGQLALVKLQEQALPEFRGLEQPPVVLPSKLGKGPNLEHLVILEGEGEDNSIRYRSLFGTTVYEIDQRQFSSMKPILKDSEIPEELQVRYVVWQLASKLLPVAGRVIQVDGDRATIGLGTRAGLKPQDTLHVIRAISSDDQSTETQSLLATTLSVTEVYEDSCRVVLGDSGLDQVFAGASLLLDDLVIANASRNISLAVLAPGWVFPKNNKVVAKLNLNNPVALQRVGREAEGVSLEFKDRVSSGLRVLGIPVFTEIPEAQIPTSGATHLLGGYIEPIDQNRYHMETMVYPLKSINAGLIRDPKWMLTLLGQELARIEFDINLLSLK